MFADEGGLTVDNSMTFFLAAWMAALRRWQSDTCPGGSLPESRHREDAAIRPLEDDSESLGNLQARRRGQEARGLPRPYLMVPTALPTPASEATPTPESRVAPAGSRVLVAEDDQLQLRAYVRALRAVGFEVDHADNGEAAVNLLLASSYDAVVSDIALPCIDGVGVLQAAHTRDPDVPVVLITGTPRLDTAVAAVEHSAFRYLLKPLSPDTLQETVIYCAQMHRLAVLRRMAAHTAAEAWSPAHDRAGLVEALDNALASVWMAFQPVVSWKRKRVFAYEGLLRNEEAMLANPGTLLSAAERLGRVGEVGRMVRDRVAAQVRSCPAQFVFVNLHSQDLLDDHLYAADSPLSKVADRIVLEVTERASLASVTDIEARIAELRGLGFRIAIDDLGAGYSGLASFSTLQPEVVKYDMSLVRGVEGSPTRRKVISSMTALFAEMDMQVVAEGVETAAERDTLLELGVDLFQGYLFAKPARGFGKPEF
jgi:EAL domain-containing protein (putative c-di-GMP-specific phosphodiesterase class I)/ActR/RegA family two-component response regulator